MFCNMITNYVEKINDKNGVPNISSAWESIVENEYIIAFNQAIEEY